MRRQAADGACGDALRRERDDAVLQGVGVLFKAGEVAFVRHAQVGGVVRAFFFRAEEGSFKVAAEDTRHAARSVGDGCYGAVVVVFGVGDEGRQHGDGAKLAVRGEDVGEAVGIKMLIDEKTAAAVCLGFDEAGGKDAAAEVMHGGVCRDVARGGNGEGFVVFHEQGVAFEQHVAVIDAGAGVCGFHGVSPW